MGSRQTRFIHGIRTIYHSNSRCPIKCLLHRLRLHRSGIPGSATRRQSPGRVYPSWRSFGASLILISGGRSLYTRAGDRLFGRALRFRLDPAVTEPLRAVTGKQVRIRAMRPQDLFHLQRLMEQREAGYVTTASELNKSLGASAYSNVIRLEQSRCLSPKKTAC